MLINHPSPGSSVD